MSDFICYGYKQMAAQVKDAEGRQMFTTKQFRARYAKPMKRAGILFKWRQPGDIGAKRVSVWFSHLRDFLRLRYQIEVGKDEI